MILIEMSLNQNVGKRQSKLMTTRKLHFSCEKNGCDISCFNPPFLLALLSSPSA